MREKTIIKALESRIPLSLKQGNGLPQMPHSSAVESQGAKWAIFSGKSREMNRIGARGKRAA
jgi:hypothetical protein